MNYHEDEAHDHPSIAHRTQDALQQPQQYLPSHFGGGGWSEESKLSGLFAVDRDTGVAGSNFGLLDDSLRGHDTLLPHFNATHVNATLPSLHTQPWTSSSINAPVYSPWGSQQSSSMQMPSNTGIPQPDQTENNYQQMMLQPGMEQALLLYQLQGLQGNAMGPNVTAMTPSSVVNTANQVVPSERNMHTQVVRFGSNLEPRIAPLSQGSALPGHASQDLPNFINTVPAFQPKIELMSSHLLRPPEPTPLPPMLELAPALGPSATMEDFNPWPSSVANSLGSDPFSPFEAPTQPTFKERSKNVQAQETRNRQLKLTPSERSFIVHREWKTQEEVLHVLHVLGTTLRSKADPYFDATTLPVTHVPRSPRGGVSELFPDKLYRMLTDLESQGQCDVVSFLPHGRAFTVHKLDVFQSEILPRFFRGQTKWSSFSRQLNLYGFLRISCGRDSGAYYHELFLKNRPYLLLHMRRVGAPTGLDRRRYKLPDGTDPDFYAMKPP